MRRARAFALVLLGSLPAGPAGAQSGPVGTADFAETVDGAVINVHITGNVPPGTHGLHIHETAEQGFDNPNGPHAGDLENTAVTQAGTASYEYVNDRITLSENPNSVLDSDGSAIIVHAMEDNYWTNRDPQAGPGMSGDRVAAGTIEAAEPMPTTGGANVLPPP